jgi:hypothetical protein
MRLVREVGRAEHASTEQLSALLDGRSEPDEQQFLAGHVVGCVVCSNELADLRSVQSLLRSMPVYLPPRSFTVSIESVAVQPRRFGRLISFSRVLGTVAAVLCVVLFSVDAMQSGYDAPTSTASGGSAMQLNPLGTFEAIGPVGAQGNVRQAPESRSAAEAGPAETSSKAPSAPAAERAPFATQASLAAAPPVAAGRAAEAPASASAWQGQPAEAPTATSPWWSPIRLWSLGLALAAACLLALSMVLSRIARKPAIPRDEWTGI